MSNDWMTVHWVRFSEPVDGRGNPQPGPAAADTWRFCPASPIGEDGLYTGVSDEWGGFALYSDRTDAEEVFADPGAHLPFLDQTIEAWHALALPVSHRGKVGWRGTVLENSAITSAASDPGGPLVVFTSAGFDDPGPDDLPRIRHFVREVAAVQEYYRSLPGNIRNAVFNGGAVDGIEGATVSLWSDDAAMVAAAYRPGHHRTQMDYQKETGTGFFDFSSFTRARILASAGTWGGSDPVLEMAEMV